MTKRLEHVFGPYAGQMIDMPDDEADAAIAGHWAREALGPIDVNAELPPNLTPEERQSAMEAADAWAAAARGESEPKNGETKPAAKRDLSAAGDDKQSYSTRRK